MPSVRRIFIQSNGKPVGPSSPEEVKSLISAGWLSSSDLGQYEGETEWRPLSSMPELSDAPPASPPPPVQPPPPPKSRIDLGRIARACFRIAVLLVVALGAVYGAFYLVKNYWPKNDTGQRPVPQAESTGVSKATPETGTSTQTIAEASSPIHATTSAPTAILVPTRPATNIPPWEAVSPGSPKPTNTPAVETKAAPTPTPAGSDLKAVASLARRTVQSSVDPKTTPFGSYDVAAIKTVQKRWFELIDQSKHPQGKAATVVIAFKLDHSGAVSDLKVVESNGDEMQVYLCKQAVLDTRFAPWPPALEKTSTGASRDLQFTFRY